MKRRRGGCIGCGGPCETDRVDNFGSPYKGCSRGCRLLSQAEIDALTKPVALQIDEDRGPK